MNLIPTLAQQPGPSLRRCLLGWLMRIANRHPLHRWYDNKNLLLCHYGENDGFDLQTVHATCWTCGGDEDGCQDCDYCGIHHTTRTILWRRIVGTCVFHTPGSTWKPSLAPFLEAADGFRANLHGRITHRPTDHRAAREAIGAILLLCGCYGQWWRHLTCGNDWETRTGAFPTTNPGLYPQHLLACAIARIRAACHCDWHGDDMPF